MGVFKLAYVGLKLTLYDIGGSIVSWARETNSQQGYGKHGSKGQSGQQGQGGGGSGRRSRSTISGDSNLDSSKFPAPRFSYKSFTQHLKSKKEDEGKSTSVVPENQAKGS